MKDRWKVEKWVERSVDMKVCSMVAVMDLEMGMLMVEKLVEERVALLVV